MLALTTTGLLTWTSEGMIAFGCVLFGCVVLVVADEGLWELANAATTIFLIARSDPQIKGGLHGAQKNIGVWYVHGYNIHGCVGHR